MSVLFYGLIRDKFRRIRKRTSQRSEPVSFLIQKQRVRKCRTKHFPNCNLFILYLLKFSPSTRFLPFIRHNKCQVIFSFLLSASTLALLRQHSEHFFLTECLPRHQSTLQLRFVCFPCFALLRVLRHFLAW